ncbi:MAG TPA: macro domain-containing protein [Armatimonadota bacterium]|nr:macro domain-containing protein [Armatimonadota bacterium]HOJ21507.1 macro domain-containing protein [Armatimonadota bacterium]HOM82870.1 macro domain-containing protein [Armatimonadota bacterium]HOQ29549.1 macro domain-containing protein [Armatimonadota bacterium]HPO71743.1 macro domain-containing protein [Armatimonadota bacterium]
MQVNQTTLTVVRGSVLDQETDAIVNAANTKMRGGGGVDGAIHRAAGPELLEELKRVAPNGAPTGTAVLTGGHRLKQPYIIHTPGPVWHGGTRGEPELLASCYRSCMEVAHKKGLESIAFCSISTGVYGYPIERAAPLALSTVRDFLQAHPDTSLRRVVFAMFGAEEYRVFTEALGTLEKEGA